MKLIDKLERKFGRFGIPNLTMYIIVCYVLGYLIQMTNSNLMSLLSLEPAYILRGQIWRLVTWVISPPSSSNILWFAVAIFFFYYPIGTALERTWGSFRYTLYIFSGLIFTVIGAFVLYFILGSRYLVGDIFSTYYISLSIFLAYAVTNPNMQILLMFVIPVKMIWMAVLYGLIIAYDMFNSIRNGYWFMTIPIIASLLNFVIYFFSLKDMHRYHPKEIHRRKEFRRVMEPKGRTSADGTITKHKCAICGRTEKDDPNLEFRFCSRCNGNYEYCQDHLFTHEHVK